MGNEERSIEIPQDGSAASGISSVPPSVTKRLTSVENIVQAVMWVGVITMVSVVVAVVTLVLDQMHFNNQTYRDQSEVTNKQYEELSTKIDVLKKQLEAEPAKTVDPAIQDQ